MAFFIADWEVAVGTILGGSVATISEMVISVMIQFHIAKNGQTWF